MLLAAQTTRNIALLIVLVMIGGWIAYLYFNTRWSRPETGAEVELAPNRKPYFEDEELEGGRLEKFQLFGLAMLVISAVGIPAYWVLEPARQNGAKAGYDKRFASWGSQLFAPTAEGGFNCAGCHGGMNAGGGAADYTITDPTTGEVKAVSWKAPALNTVMYRFSEEEVTDILVNGRPFSPMSPWGVEGGGPMNEQQISNLVAYLKSIQIPQEGCTKEDPMCNGPGADVSKAKQDEIQKAAEAAVAKGDAASIGEAIFNLELDSGAYGCARCHTNGWSYDNPGVTAGGAFGPNITGGAEVRQFPNRADNEAFICSPPEQGKKYGQQGQSSGRMPGFCSTYTDEQLTEVVSYIRSL